jgi:hypothetical protein
MKSFTFASCGNDDRADAGALGAPRASVTQLCAPHRTA